MGIILVVLLYGLRGFIRSQMLSNVTHAREKRIRKTSGVPGTEDIPARVIVSFVWQQLGPFSRTLLTVMPISILTLSLILGLGYHASFRAIGSILVIFSTFALLFYMTMGKYLVSLRLAIGLLW